MEQEKLQKVLDAANEALTSLALAIYQLTPKKEHGVNITPDNDSRSYAEIKIERETTKVGFDKYQLELFISDLTHQIVHHEMEDAYDLALQYTLELAVELERHNRRYGVFSWGKDSE